VFVARGRGRTVFVSEEFSDPPTVMQLFLRYGLMHARITGYVQYRSLLRR